MNFISGKTKISIILLFGILCVFKSEAVSQTIKKNASENSPILKVADADEGALRVLNLVNAERAKRGLNQLLWDNDAAKMAAEYSEKMARENFFSHFDSKGESVLERAKAAKLKHWSKIGENLFSVSPSDDFDSFAVENWLKSPSHRQNMLDGEWTTTGIGIARAKDGEIFITEVFIKRR